MNTGSRGGSNRKDFNKDFFKVWSREMAYVLGFMYADGAIEDVRKSSRTCYFQITNTNLLIIQKIRSALGSHHKIQTRKPKNILFSSETYLCRQLYNLRIGSKEVYSDLISLGLSPRKSLNLKYPEIPKNYFSDFLRGYFDGDGCVSFDKKNNTLTTIFTSGTKSFLKNLSSEITSYMNVKTKKVITSKRSFQLRYSTKDSCVLFNFMYTPLSNQFHIKYKHNTYLSFFKKNNYDYI